MVRLLPFSLCIPQLALLYISTLVCAVSVAVHGLSLVVESGATPVAVCELTAVVLVWSTGSRLSRLQ